MKEDDKRETGRQTGEQTLNNEHHRGKKNKNRTKTIQAIRNGKTNTHKHKPTKPSNIPLKARIEQAKTRPNLRLRKEVSW